MVSDGHRVLVDRVLDELRTARAGAPSGAATVELIGLLNPVVHSRVERVLRTYGRGRVLTNLRAEIEEHVQRVWGLVFEQEARVLRLWQPERGLSLLNWIGRFATLRTKDVMRSAKRDPWRHQAAPPEYFDRMVSEPHAERGVATKQMWQAVQGRVLERQSEQGRAMFELLFERDATTAEIRDATDLSDAAIFKWRSRLRKELHHEWETLLSEGDP
ncbi:MAG: hypothetical protein KTR31_29555 [Myxococcales bacterium]|nr:hypothetical protein [Myxococcales bacterium]